MIFGLDWFWWIAIVLSVMVIGALKLKVWKSMTKKKPTDGRDDED
jgi:heme/copper-type cytochrome/quinol oxidase subunit 2